MGSARNDSAKLTVSFIIGSVNRLSVTTGLKNYGTNFSLFAGVSGLLVLS